MEEKVKFKIDASANEQKMYNDVQNRLSKLEELEGLNSSTTLEEVLDKKGISRRDFMKWAGVMTTTLALPASFAPLTAKAAEVANRIPVIWLHMAECTGCSESLLRTESPDIATIIFDYIHLDYHDTVMVSNGWQAEKQLEETMKKYYGRYIMMVEGAIPENQFFTVGPEATNGTQRARNVAAGASAVLAIGTCSSFGGVQAAYPNPTNAKPLSKIIDKPIINVPGCPPSDRNIIGNILYYIMFGALPALDAFNRPTWAYGLRIHDLCERRGHFDAGEFVEQFGDANAEKGFCLYKVGCKGPYTFNNCSKLRFNSHINWPIGAGHGCIGCSEPNFWDTMAPFETPLANRLFETGFKGLGADRTADYIGTTVLAATAIGIAAHAIVSNIVKEK